MSKRIDYYAIKFGDKYLMKYGAELTSDLGQARLYKNLDSWKKNSATILKKIVKSYGKQNIYVMLVALQEKGEIEND